MASLTEMPSVPGPSKSRSWCASVADGTRTSESEGEWEKNLRKTLEEGQRERLAELEDQAQDEHDKLLRELNIRVEEGVVTPYEADLHRARLVEKLENYWREIKKALEDELEQTLERERGLRKLTMGAIDFDSSELPETLMREQEELLRMFKQEYAPTKASLTPTVPPFRPPSAPDSHASTRPQRRPVLRKLSSSQTPDPSRSSSQYRSQAPQLTHQTSSGMASTTSSLFSQRPDRASCSGQTSYGARVPDTVYGTVHEELEEMSGEDVEESEESEEESGSSEGEGSSEKDEEGFPEEKVSYQYGSPHSRE